jgi:hypothetical protein
MPYDPTVRSVHSRPLTAVQLTEAKNLMLFKATQKQLHYNVTLIEAKGINVPATGHRFSISLRLDQSGKLSNMSS